MATKKEITDADMFVELERAVEALPPGTAGGEEDESVEKLAATIGMMEANLKNTKTEPREATQE